MVKIAFGYAETPTMLSRFLTNAVEILMLSGPGLLPKDPVGVVQGQERIPAQGESVLFLPHFLCSGDLSFSIFVLELW